MKPYHALHLDGYRAHLGLRRRDATLIARLSVSLTLDGVEIRRTVVWSRKTRGTLACARLESKARRLWHLADALARFLTLGGRISDLSIISDAVQTLPEFRASGIRHVNSTRRAPLWEHIWLSDDRRVYVAREDAFTLDETPGTTDGRDA